MENSESAQAENQSSSEKNSGPVIIFFVTLVLVALALWQFLGSKPATQPIETNAKVKQAPNENAVIAPILVEKSVPVLASVSELVENEHETTSPVVEEEVVIEQAKTPLPPLDESDAWLQGKLPELTWRNELLSLLINDDMIRRFVVFTDNFSQGLLAYDHSPFIKPKVRFSVDEKSFESQSSKNVWQWDTATSKRFDIYVDLLRSVDSTTLVNWYIEAKPLIDEAYGELGYEEDFTYTLQDAIARVLDMELPKSSMAITRTSVMYKYQDPALEALADSDKLLLRIGKENLLIIKSVLLEINEKLAKKVHNNS